MLMTKNCHKIHLVGDVESPDEQVWSQISLNLFIPYAFVTHSIEVDVGSVFQTSILWREPEILNFFENADTALDVSLLVPSKFGNPVKWRWLPIREVWRCKPLSSEDAFPMYVSTEDEKILGIGIAEYDATIARTEHLLYIAKT